MVGLTQPPAAADLAASSGNDTRIIMIGMLCLQNGLWFVSPKWRNTLEEMQIELILLSLVPTLGSTTSGIQSNLIARLSHILSSLPVGGVVR